MFLYKNNKLKYISYLVEYFNINTTTLKLEKYTDYTLKNKTILDVNCIVINNINYYISDENIDYQLVIDNISDNKKIILGKKIGYVSMNIIFIN
jgi:hypothetical protein